MMDPRPGIGRRKLQACAGEQSGSCWWMDRAWFRHSIPVSEKVEQSSLYKYWTCLLGLAAIIMTGYRVGLLGRYATLCVQENPGCLFFVTKSDSLTHLTDAQEWAGTCFFLLNHEYFFTCCALTSNWGAADIHIVDKLVNRHPVGSQLLHKISKTSLWTEPNKRKKNKEIEKKRCSIFLQSLFPVGRLSNTGRKTRSSRNQDKEKNQSLKIFAKNDLVWRFWGNHFKN